MAHEVAARQVRPVLTVDTTSPFKRMERVAVVETAYRPWKGRA